MSKDKWVRRFSVDETSRHKNGFTIYKITSVLFPIESPEAMTVVSVWKRYSDIQRLHTCMRALHAGLHLRGTFPVLPKFNYFKRFQKEVIEERAKVIKTLLEFIAEHKLLFTSTDFVNFLQTGYPEPETSSSGVINAIRTSLHLPIEDTPPLEYQTSDDDSRSPQHSAHTQPKSTDEPDFISQIPIYEPADVERKPSPQPTISQADSFQSINSLDSIGSDLYNELDKVKIQKSTPMVKKNVLPDLITFDAPSTSRFDDYHTMRNEDTISLSSTNQQSEYSASVTSTNQRSEISTNQQYSRSNSRGSCRSALSLSNVECKTKTEDSYVFEAGYLLNLAARYEDMKEYNRAFECYKSGIEKMLVGVQTDTDHQRRTLIKEKTNKYLSYAEAIYQNHLCGAEPSLLPDQDDSLDSDRQWTQVHCPIPTSMLLRPYSDLALYRVLAVLSDTMMLVLHRGEQTCYAMKVIQKVPNNLTEFDEYFLQNTIETRQPILPTVIPYMVPLHAYIETNNLIFLILSYAPGEKLFDYIKNYAKSIPNTPAREVNLENVFTEPKTKKSDDISEIKIQKFDTSDVPEIKINLDLKNENLDFNSIIEIKSDNLDKSEISILDRIEMNDSSNNNETENSKIESLDTNELVKNSQKLLKNVEKVLSQVSLKVESVKFEDMKRDVREDVEKEENKIEIRVEKGVETPKKNKLSPASPLVLPAGTVCRWGAQILTALQSVHNCGVACRDLNPSNILLGESGQVILTYFLYYPGIDMSLATIHKHNRLNIDDEINLYIAPELYRYTFVEEKDDVLEKVCDFWSFGAIMYELLCGVPLSYYHRSIFTSHTILHLPDGLPIEVQSLLTQLLTYEPSERLGAGPEGIEEIKKHPYFKHIDWTYIYESWHVPE